MRTSRPWLRGGSDLILDRRFTWFGSIPGSRSRILATTEIRACDDSIGATGARAMGEGRSSDVGTWSEIRAFQGYVPSAKPSAMMRVRYGPAGEGEFVEVAKADDAFASQKRRFPPVGRAGLRVRVTQVQPGRWKERRVTGSITSWAECCSRHVSVALPGNALFAY